MWYTHSSGALTRDVCAQVSLEERATFILLATPLVRKDLRHLFLELLEPDCHTITWCVLSTRSTSACADVSGGTHHMCCW